MHIQIDSPLLLAGCCAAAGSGTRCVCPRPGWDSEVAELQAGQQHIRRWVCCLLLGAGRPRGVLHCGEERHPQTRCKETSSNTSLFCCLRVVVCLAVWGVSPGWFQGITVDMLVGSQARLEHYLLVSHQGSADTCKTTQAQIT